MLRPIITCYQPDPALSWERQCAVDVAWHSLKTEAAIHLDRKLPQLARMRARDCRRLVSAFGVRLAERRVVSVAQQEALRGGRA